MKDYVSIKKEINEIINKLNKLKKTAKDVCINISIKKGKTKKRRRIKANTNKKIVSKGNQYSNVYNSTTSNISPSLNLEPLNKMNKTNSMSNKTNSMSNKSINSTNSPNSSNLNKSTEINEPIESAIVSNQTGTNKK